MRHRRRGSGGDIGRGPSLTEIESKAISPSSPRMLSTLSGSQRESWQPSDRAVSPVSCSSRRLQVADHTRSVKATMNSGLPGLAAPASFHNTESTLSKLRDSNGRGAGLSVASSRLDDSSCNPIISGRCPGDLGDDRLVSSFAGLRRSLLSSSSSDSDGAGRPDSRRRALRRSIVLEEVTVLSAREFTLAWLVLIEE